MNLLEGTLVLAANALSFQPTAGRDLSGTNSTLELPPATAHRLRGREKVVLGLRPEQIAVCGDDTAGAVGRVIRARVTSVQTAGSDSYVQAQWHGASMLVRVPSTSQLEPGRDYRFVIDLARACFFDASSTKAIV
jgi:ABC-type sugar transport system ATPase subunit